MPGQGRRLIGKEACMRRILMLSLIAAAACGPSSGKLLVDWSFEGLSCAEAGVATIQMDVAGEILSPDHFSCVEAPQGVDLGVYDAGNYQLTITGTDANGVVTHQVTQTLRVNGGRTNQYAVDVPRIAATTTATANVSWIFDNDRSKTCAAAGVDQVTIMVDPDSNGSGGINAGTVLCTAGNPSPSIQQPVAPLTPGTHTFAILGSRGTTLVYRTHNPVAAFFAAGFTTNVEVSGEPLP
jgi:hypothetical protein